MKPIANSDLRVSPLSMGTAGLGTEIRGDDVDRLLDLYVEHGGNFLDSAHVYACWVPGGTGASERAVGDWMRKRGNRDDLVVGTKGGHPPMGESYAHAEEFLNPDALRQDVSESLERLGTDRIDLYYLHRDDGKTPVAEIVDALNDLSGPRFFGASNWSVARVAEANTYAASTGKRGFVALQNQWSLAIPVWRPTEEPTVRYVEDADPAWCAANGVTIHAYSSTANGYFADDRTDGPFTGNEGRRARARELGERLGKSPTQIALAWLLNQPGSVIPILGTTKTARLEEGVGAVGIELDADTLAWLRT